MRLAAGTHVGPYEILAPLGAGGMGEVYRARDTRLGREVAIKVLPQHLLSNPEILARFEREARTISSFNHPHICTLHDVGREGDTEYLVMELVEGETLAQRLTKGALPMPELLRLAIQIADALDRAHRAGIVHRDFKPGNVMITRSGAKLMDFGLARTAAVANGATGSGVTLAHLSQSPTVASPLTAEGTLVGTFLYMAPEQLEGKEADARSDLWAFGCVLYEMATGKRAFEGKSQASLIGSIMHSEPPAIAGADIPPSLEALVRACLVKDPDERIQTAHDVKLQLTWMAGAGSQSGVAAPVLPRRRFQRETIAWAVAAVAIGVAAFATWRGRGGQTDVPQIRFTVPVPPNVSGVDLPRISPDGRTIAFLAQSANGQAMLWVRPLQSLTANPLPGTEGAGRAFWSPDSRYLAFFAGGKLKKIPVTGGPPEQICDAESGADGSWGRAGVILFDGGTSDPIRRVNASGGVAAPAMPLDSTVEVGWPMFLPDGKHYLYVALASTNQLMVGTLGQPRGKSLGIPGSRVEYASDGHLLFVRERTLLAQKFDTGSLKLVGEPFPLADSLPIAGNAQANFSVSNNGVLLYRATGAANHRLIWIDRSGRELSEVAPAAQFRAPSLSPDGKRVAIRRLDARTSPDVWTLDLARGTSTRFTFDPGADGNPLWSPDGSKIAWFSDRGGSPNLFIKSASGLGADQLLFKSSALNVWPSSWTPDGSALLFDQFDARNGSDIWELSMSPGAKPTPVLQTPFAETQEQISPDGRWMAYSSNESGRYEVYVATFKGEAGKWQVSTQGGTEPRWRGDGKELFYISPDQKLMSVPITPGASFTPGMPSVLFPARAEPAMRNTYCVAADGQRFLFLKAADEQATPMTVVVNWRAGLSAR